MKVTRFIFPFFTVLWIMSCSEQSDFREKKVILKSGETVFIKEIGLTLTNKGCGREWVSDEGKPSYERPYCELVYKKGDKTLFAGSDFKPVHIGTIEITLEKINPWGRVEDSIPPGGCRLNVKLLEGR